MPTYDVVVIGSGPGGYVAAIRAAQLGKKTLVIEKDAIGGRCLNYACIPAKAVLRSADVLTEVREADVFGITVSKTSVDFAKVTERRAQIVKTLTGGVAGLLKKNKIDVRGGDCLPNQDRRGQRRRRNDFSGIDHSGDRFGAASDSRNELWWPRDRDRGGVGTRRVTRLDGRGRRRGVGD
jgi:hypothetical protein